MTQDTNTQTCVLYNGGCPICSAEIDHYARYSERYALPLRFDDLQAIDLASWGLTAEDAARRLHVRKNGAVYVGIPAFLVLWNDMPRYRPLAHVVGLPGIRQAASLFYDYVLAPSLFRRHLRRQSRRSPSS